MDKMHQTPNVPGTEPVTDNPNPGGTQGINPQGPTTGTESSNVKTFRCSDVGMEGCRWEAAGRSEQDLRQQIERHGREAHGLKEIGKDMWDRIREKIRDKAA
jgi:predicted small metal-binding protein